MTSKEDRPVALVTGASSGLGKQMATALSGAGYRVFGTSRDPRAAEAAHRVEMLAMNVDSDASVESAVSEIAAATGRLDLVVCNAGFGMIGVLESTPVEDMIAQFQTNVFGVHRVCLAVLPHLRRRPRAKLVVTGSLAGRVGLPFQGLYSASKFALKGYCEALRAELRGSSVAVCLLEPGDFPTGFTAARRCSSLERLSPANLARLERAQAIITQDENEGGDLSMIEETIVAIAAHPAPPLRWIVASAEQRELLEVVRPSLADGEWEALIAEHYGIEGC